jgi:ferredoxin
MMVVVCFVSANGETVQQVEARVGDNLLSVAQAAGQPLEGTCEGQMACSTCHVIFTPEEFARLPRASEEEEDMLDLAASATRTSRLACQIDLTEEIGNITVHIPAVCHNMQGV